MTKNSHNYSCGVMLNAVKTAMCLRKQRKNMRKFFVVFVRQLIIFSKLKG